MKPVLTTLLFCQLLMLNACAQVKPDAFSECFFVALKHYQVDSLKSMLGFDFQFHNAVIPNQGITQEKAFEAYVSTAARYHKKYMIKKVIHEQHRSFLVEEQSEYLHALGVAYPEFIFTLTPDDMGRLGKLSIDTTKDYPAYTKQLQEKGRQFEEWRRKKMVQPNGLSKYGDPTPAELPEILKEYEKEH